MNPEKPKKPKPSKPAEPVIVDRSLLARLEVLLRAYFSRYRGLPAGMPAEVPAAARWFRDHLFERRREGESEALRDERVLYCAAKFLGADSALQAYVVAARADGVFWRGDELDYFVRVVDETLRMRAMTPEQQRAYRRGVWQNLAAVVAEAQKKPDCDNSMIDGGTNGPQTVAESARG